MIQLYQTTLKITPKTNSVLLNLSNMKKNSATAMSKSFTIISKMLEKTAKLGIKNPPKTGRIYIIKGQRHQASKKSEFPAYLSGELYNSINSKKFSNKIIFGSTKDYGKYLEKGRKARNGTFVGARPFLLKSIINTRAKQILEVEKNFKKYVEKI